MAPSARAAAAAVFGRGHTSIDLPNGWKVGTRLGEGAQGSVYAVVDAQGRPTEWAVKVTAQATSKTSKAQAEARANATSLYNEGLLYKAHLRPLCGTVVPRTPENCQGVHESNGYLCLIMERMECDLFGKVEELANNSKSSFISIGPLAQQMVQLVEHIHNVKQLVIDVKPENFMFIFPATDVPLEKRLRLVDFGLMRAFQRPDQLGDFHGNAMYASLHMHTLHNSSRRDDLEMVCYVLGELVIRLHAAVQGNTAEYEQSAIPAYLPWSQEKSDEDLFTIKQLNVEDLNSDFYKRMPVPAARVLFECLREIWTYNFKSTPQYASLSNKLGTLCVPNSSGNNQKKPADKPRARRAARRASGQENEESNTESTPLTTTEDNDTGRRVLRSGSKAPPAKAAPKSRTVATQTDGADLSPLSKRQASSDASENGGGRRWKHSRMDNVSDMEVDEIIDVAKDDDDNDKLLGDADMKDASDQSSDSADPEQRNIQVVIEMPDQKDLIHNMAANETIIFGSKPSSEGSETLIEIPDRNVAANHVKLSLVTKKQRILRAVVMDLNTTRGTEVGREGITKPRPIKKGSESSCMIPGQIYIGSSIIYLKRR